MITAPFRGLALGVFLITVGMSLDLGADRRRLGRIARSPWSACARQGRWSPALLLRLGGARSAVAAETGLLMASPSETTLIVLAAASAAGLIDAADAAILDDGDRDRPHHHPLPRPDRPPRRAPGRPAAAMRSSRPRDQREAARGDHRLRPGRPAGRGDARPSTTAPMSRSIRTSTRSPPARARAFRSSSATSRGPSWSTGSSSAMPPRSSSPWTIRC